MVVTPRAGQTDPQKVARDALRERRLHARLAVHRQLVRQRRIARRGTARVQQLGDDLRPRRVLLELLTGPLPEGRQDRLLDALPKRPQPLEPYFVQVAEEHLREPVRPEGAEARILQELVDLPRALPRLGIAD